MPAEAHRVILLRRVVAVDGAAQVRLHLAPAADYGRRGMRDVARDAQGVCGPAGLYAEEYDVRQRQLRGNLPQAFVLSLLIETALRLAAPPR